MSNLSKKRPVHLDIKAIRLPITGLVSILHRISGVILFLGLPWVFCLLSQSLRSESSFNLLKKSLHEGMSIWLLWILISAAIYHILAGARHTLMDLGVGESLSAGRLTAKCVLLLAILAIIMVGVWLWQ